MFSLLYMIFAIHITVSFYYISFFFFFNDTATTEIYTLSLHDALPISERRRDGSRRRFHPGDEGEELDRKSTRLNSSHVAISYAVFCLKKKKKIENIYNYKKKKKNNKINNY